MKKLSSSDEKKIKKQIEKKLWKNWLDLSEILLFRRKKMCQIFKNVIVLKKYGYSLREKYFCQKILMLSTYQLNKHLNLLLYKEWLAFFSS